MTRTCLSIAFLFVDIGHAASAAPVAARNGMVAVIFLA
jgi:hypothetical protein